MLLLACFIYTDNFTELTTVSGLSPSVMTCNGDLKKVISSHVYALIKQIHNNLHDKN